VAETPVELMRSRYAAYAKGEVDYVVETTDPQGEAWQEPVAEWRAEIRRFGRDAEFLGVEILDAAVDGDAGEVEFRARLRANGRDTSFEERSVFVRRAGRWLYTTGSVASEK
jgi:SEC-C motif-containing protein